MSLYAMVSSTWSESYLILNSFNSLSPLSVVRLLSRGSNTVALLTVPSPNLCLNVIPCSSLGVLPGISIVSPDESSLGFPLSSVLGTN